MSQRDTLLSLLRDGRILRYRDLAAVSGGSVKSMALTRLAKEKESPIEPVLEGGRVIGYKLKGSPDSIFDRIAARHPGAVLCGRSAAQHWDLTDSVPGSLPEQIAVPYSSNRRSPLEHVELVGWSDPKLFEVGVVAFDNAAGKLRITDAARTVLDMFRPVRGRSIDKVAATEALARLYAREGDEALARIGEYAMALRCFRAVEPHVRMLKEAVRWAPAIRTP